MGYRRITVRALAGLAGAAAVVTVPLTVMSGVANADPGLGWGAPGPGILPGLGFGGVGGPASGLGLLPGAGLGAPGAGLLPGPGLGGLGGPLSGLGLLPGAGVGLPGPGLI
ncbi:hypothetical protein [Mycolicibacterium rhodesiae]|uniref:Uncharacterized protein n=1 Tax=Mycolicibacterium rhodesiae TaxID=36814 RepID=A0A1X0IZ92_MYCRH|nr:hypothetical protein [Mycolicibacterium rhodesiae]MCV7346760.1 hypothetical protein [Mycolicibacterium rhodesiae]ORB54171.1 hypothetical protein BST42_11330 [Mycolicibacterium rhodesiae]